MFVTAQHNRVQPQTMRTQETSDGTHSKHHKYIIKNVLFDMNEQDKGQFPPSTLNKALTLAQIPLGV